MEDKKILVSRITDFAKNMRKNILDMALVAGANSSHLGGALSIVEILSTLFGSKIKIDNKNNLGFSDRFILSKGHACLALYSALVEKKILKKKELETFESDGSALLGHPIMNKLSELTKFNIFSIAFQISKEESFGFLPATTVNHFLA